MEMADPTKMPELGLGFTLWEGSFLDVEARWLRFVDGNGDLLLTGSEKSRLESSRADQEAQRADQEAQRADQTKTETIRAFFESGAPMEMIEKATGLSREQIESLLAL